MKVQEKELANKNRVFISHSSLDASIAQQIVSKLEASGLPCWIAPRDLVPGADYNANLSAGIRSCTALIVVESRNSMKSDQVIREIDAAVNRRIPVIPVRLAVVQRSDAMDHLLRICQWIDAFPPPVDRHLEKILVGVQRALEVEVAAKPQSDDAEQDYIGGYRILNVLGEGGMGIVYLAEQRTPIRRTVALKRIRLGLDTSDVLARFDSERQALARMDHPNIAKVLDAGADERGRPYFVMEYVPGKPITEFADENKLTIEQRLQLFLLACEAIDHAHTKAIIHRDIKPGNVLAFMADGKPQLKVIDFGIAKALTSDRLTDRSYATARGLAIGTLEYMSPEQAEGAPDIDVRADVYSLGALLYELLSGVKVFDPESISSVSEAEAYKMIREVVPTRPSTRISELPDSGEQAAAKRALRNDVLASRLRSELEWIPLKALRKERDRRYNSARALAEDIHNYLEDRPLSAGPETFSYRVQKSLRRNRGTFTTAAVVLLTLIAGVAFYIRSIKQEQQRTANALQQLVDEQEKKELALQTAKQQSELAARRFEEKRDALDEMLSTFSDESLKRQPGSQQIRQAFLQRGLKQYQSLLADRSRDAEVTVQTVNTLRELGVVSKELGQLVDGLDSLEQAVDVCRQSLELSPSDDRLVAALIDSLYELGQAYVEQKRYEDVVEIGIKGLELCEPLMVQHPDSAFYKGSIARFLILKSFLMEQGQGANPDSQRAINLLREVVSSMPDNAESISDLGRAINNHAFLAFSDEDVSDENKSALEEAVKLQENALKLDSASVYALSRQSRFGRNLALLFRRRGENGSSIALLSRILESSKQFVKQNPTIPEGRQAISDLLDVLAFSEVLNKQREVAIGYYQELVEVNKRILQADANNETVIRTIIVATQAIAENYDALGKKSKSTDVLGVLSNSINELITPDLKSESLLGEVMTLHMLYGAGLINQKQVAEANEAYERAFQIFDRHSSSLQGLNPQYIHCYLRCCQGQYQLAEQENSIPARIESLENRLNSIDLDQISLPSNVRIAADVLLEWAELYQQYGQFQKALDLRLRVIKKCNETLAGDPISYWPLYRIVVLSHEPLAQIYAKLEQPKQAFEQLRKYFAITEPYVRGRKHDELLEKTKTYSLEGLARLTRDFNALNDRPNLTEAFIKFQVDGEFESQQIVVGDSWKFLQDQFLWYERSGKRIVEEDQQFYRKLYDISKANGFSFAILFNFAKTPLTNNAESSAAFQRMIEQQKRVRAAPEDTEKRYDLGMKTLELASALENEGQPAQAKTFIDDAEEELERCLINGFAYENRINIFRVHLQAVKGRVSLRSGNLVEAYDQLLTAFRKLSAHAESDSALSGMILLDLAQTCDQLNRTFESAIWYLKAGEAGYQEGVVGLASRLSADTSVQTILPPDLRKRLDAVKSEGSSVGGKLRKIWPEYSPIALSLSKRPRSGGWSPAKTETTDDEMFRVLTEAMGNRTSVICLRGKNTQGDMIYCYLKTTYQRQAELKDAISGPENFNLSDFGEVLAAGMGEPSSQISDYIRKQYTNVEFGSLSGSNAGTAETMESWEEVMNASPNFLPILLSARATKFAKQGDFMEVARCADKLREIAGESRSTLYNAACVNALAAGLTNRLPTPLTSAQQIKRKFYTDNALSLLAKSIELGITLDQIAKGEDFASLRGNEKFIKLTQPPEPAEGKGQASVEEPSEKKQGEKAATKSAAESEGNL